MVSTPSIPMVCKVALKSPTTRDGTSPRLRSQAMAAITSAALSAAALSPSGQPYTCTTCKALARPACTTMYWSLARSSSDSSPWMGST
eukprot:10668679-Lingulodinium_polyedra.AAC.1